MLLKDYRPQPKLRVVSDTRNLPTAPVFDAHTHWGRLLLGEEYAQRYDTQAVVEKMRSLGVCGVVNLDGEEGDYLLRMLEKQAVYGDFFHTFGNITTTRLDEPGFDSYVYRTLKASKEAGISGLKFWKVIGLAQQDKHGKYFTPDDPRLQCIWQYAAQLDLPVLFHIADPIAFFDPLDADNERYEELCDHPDWMFDKAQFHPFWTLMEHQENLLAQNPQTTFIIAHVGSCAEDLAFVARQLDKFPNMYIDIAARIAELGRQPYTARKFMTKYAQRILYGSDSTPLSFHNYPTEFRFLETWDEYFDYCPAAPIPPQGRWKIYGLGLPREVLDQIYSHNALRLLGKS